MTLPLIYSGKVRDIFFAADDQLLMVASDRISAFDVIFEEPIAEKGRVLTGLTAFWLKLLKDVAPNHLITTDPSQFPADAQDIPDLPGRSMLVKKAKMLPVECIVRGYLSGSAYKEYKKSGTMHGTKLPEGLQESEKLPEPVFTPSTKADIGKHDENISFEQAVGLVGESVAKEARRICLEAYTKGSEWAASRGIIIADTKFELGFIDGKLSICDEVLTPDSSRFWPADKYEVGKTPPSYDKQPVRDWAESTGWDKTPPPPQIPDDVVKASSERYVAGYEKITGQSLNDWPGARN